MKKSKKAALVLVAVLLSFLLLLAGSFAVFSAMSTTLYEKQYEEYRDKKTLVSLCLKLEDSTDYERQLKYMKELIDRVELEEFKQILPTGKALDEEDKEICYQVILTRYLEAYLHLGKTEQYLSEFPVIYKKYPDERQCFEYIEYSLSDDILSEKQLDTVLAALEAHLKQESNVVQLSNLAAQAGIYSYQGNKLKLDEVLRRSEQIRRELLEQGKKSR